MNVHPAGGSLPHAAADAVLVMGAHAMAEDVTAVIHAEAPGVRVVTAAGRQTFLECLQTRGWALLIVSFDSDEYSGPMAMQDAMALSSAPLIAIGAAPLPHQVAGALRDGAEDFIASARSEVLGARVARLLGRAGARPRGMEDQEARFAHATSGQAEHHAMLLDRQWRVTDCGRGVAEMLGYQEGDLIGRAFESLVVGVPEAAEFLRRLRGCVEQESCSDSVWMLRRDGLRMRAEVTCVADPGEGGQEPRFRVVIRDTTLHYRATQSVRNQADAAAAATARRNLFLGSIAHEIRGALGPISTSAMVLQRKVLEPVQLERLVGIIQRNSASAARLVEDLLTFSTVSENKLLMRHEEVDLHRLVAECADAAQQHALAAKIRLQVEVAPFQADARLKCDADRIRQVVANLIGNAIKFTPPGGSIQVRTSCGPDGVHIEVADNGAGIDPAALPFIFEPFEQGGTDITARFGGFGLGLAICAVIAKQHGGSMTASSRGRGQGASFRLSLPQHGAASGSRERHPHDPMALHVLYVEDNPDAADAMRYALTKLGWTMTHAATCASARELVGDVERAFDVVLADLGLPDGSGLELGQELCCLLPVVALTAYGAPLGMQGFASQLIKPAEIAEVQRALLRAVAVHRKRVAQ